ncbi:MAG: tetratricopeptide repeat protein [Myxococcales bacterium]|nr:tetratricopeptide repeat protein [Myxococcales bacterium]
MNHRLVALVLATLSPLSVSLSGCIGRARINPKAIAQLRAGTRALAADRLDEAQARLTIALEYNPSFPEAYNGLGLIAYRRQQLVAAARFFRDAILRREDFAEAHNNLGVVLLAQHDLLAARASFRAALAVDPGYVNARYNLVLVDLRRGALALARRELLKVIALAPKMADAHAELGCLELVMSRRARAEAHLRRALALDARSVPALRCRARLAREGGDLPGAERGYRRALAIDPHDSGALYGLAVTLALANRSADAVAFVARVVRQRPRFAAAHFVLGYLLAKQHAPRVVAAEASLRRALQLTPRYPAAHLALADLLVARGQQTAATTHYRAFLTCVPAELAGERARVVAKLALAAR